MKVFLSYSFHSEDRALATALEQLLSSHDIYPDKGNRLGGGRITPEIYQHIDGSDGLVALKTKREPVRAADENGWRTSRWIVREYNYARRQGKRAIALVEKGVETGRRYRGYEQIPFLRENPLDAFLALSETLRLWKKEVGIERVVQIWPKDLGEVLRTNRDLTCRYRFVSPRGEREEWVETEPLLQGNETLLFLKGVRDNDTFIEVEIVKDKEDEPCWWSRMTPQFMLVEMKERKDQP